MTLQNWQIDPSHTEIQFKAKHLMITTVSGTFQEYTAKITTEGEDFSTTYVEFEAQISSIQTHNEQRDQHLKSADFFDVENWPVLRFESVRIIPEKDQFLVEGNLTLKGISKLIRLDMEIGGVANDPWGNRKAGITLSGKINRKDFGLSFHVLNEAGNLLVSDDIKIICEVQLIAAAE